MKKGSKKKTCKNNFYLAVLSQLKSTTNLSKIQKDLGISKQNLNYYLRKLSRLGFIESKGEGWYEITKKGKNPTKYDIFLKKDMTRGHAYIWETEIEKIPENWKDRIKVLDKKGVNYKLVGALKNVPRIKVLGRKVWLCNDHLRIFDTEKSSYYGGDAIESRKTSKLQAIKIVHALENKLGLRLNPNKIKFKKEHYALIRNDLATDMNQKGVVLEIRDDMGNVWLLVDDSLGEGGELENIGKKAYKTNIPMQKWWNDNKKHKFEVTPTKTLEMINQVTQNQVMFAQNFESHVGAIKELGSSVRELTNQVKQLQEENRKLRNGKNI